MYGLQLLFMCLHFVYSTSLSGCSSGQEGECAAETPISSGICGPGEFVSLMEVSKDIDHFNYLSTKLVVNRAENTKRFDISKSHYTVFHTGGYRKFITCEKGDVLVGCTDDIANIELISQLEKNDFSFKLTLGDISKLRITRLALCRTSKVLSFPFDTYPSINSKAVKETFLKYPGQVFEKESETHGIIIGTMKGGTTSLMDLVQAHPQVTTTLINTEEILEDTPALVNVLEEGTRGDIVFYSRYFEEPRRYEMQYWNKLYSFVDVNMHVKYAKRKSAEGEIFSFEKTPQYICDPVAAYRIAHHFPETKIVALLRDPVARYLSEYQMVMRNIFIVQAPSDKARKCPTILERFKMEFSRMKRAWEHYKSSAAGGEFGAQKSANLYCKFIDRGFYYYQLKVWVDLFKEEQLLILRSEDYFADEKATLDSVVEFFGLEKLDRLPEVWQDETLKLKFGELNEVEKRILEIVYEPHNKLLKEELGIEW